jgi:hypothetical protein
MKREIFFFGVVGCVACLGLWRAVNFNKTQKQAFHQAKRDRDFCRQKNQALKEDILF